MTDLEESLIIATINEGAENTANKRFSTKSIAANCGVSEFTLFSIFKTKENLVAVTNDYALQDFIKASQKAAMFSSNITDYVKKMIYWGFLKPAEMSFLANYGFWIGKTEIDPSRIALDYKRSVEAAKQAFTFLSDYDDDTHYLVWSFITRNINYFVQNVYCGMHADSLAYRHDCAEMLNGGLETIVNDLGENFHAKKAN
jgi:hypothetical protein